MNPAKSAMAAPTKAMLVLTEINLDRDPDGALVDCLLGDMVAALV
jgi:hypothetical protein